MDTKEPCEGRWGWKESIRECCLEEKMHELVSKGEVCITQEKTKVLFQRSSSLTCSSASFISPDSSCLSPCSSTTGILSFSVCPSCLKAIWNILLVSRVSHYTRLILTHSSRPNSHTNFSRKLSLAVFCMLPSNTYPSLH